MTKKTKTRRVLLEDLNKESPPCKICISMNDREVKDEGDNSFFPFKECVTELGPNYKGESVCIDAHKTQIRIAFLNYFEHKKPLTPIEKIVSKAKVYLEKIDSNTFPCNIDEIKILLENSATPIIINEKLEDKTRLHQVSHKDITFYNNSKRLVLGLRKYKKEIK